MVRVHNKKKLHSAFALGSIWIGILFQFKNLSLGLLNKKKITPVETNHFFPILSDKSYMIRPEP